MIEKEFIQMYITYFVVSAFSSSRFHHHHRASCCRLVPSPSYIGDLLCMPIHDRTSLVVNTFGYTTIGKSNGYLLGIHF